MACDCNCHGWCPDWWERHETCHQCRKALIRGSIWMRHAAKKIARREGGWFKARGGDPLARIQRARRVPRRKRAKR